MKLIVKKQTVYSAIASGLLLTYSAVGYSDIIINHAYANDKLPLVVYMTDSSGNCSYKDEDRLFAIHMPKAGVTHKNDTYSTFHLGIDEVETKYCIKTLYNEGYPNDNCKVGPIKNVKHDCTFTFTKPAGNQRTPGLYLPDTDYEACGTVNIDECETEG